MVIDNATLHTSMPENSVSDDIPGITTSTSEPVLKTWSNARGEVVAHDGHQVRARQQARLAIKTKRKTLFILINRVLTVRAQSNYVLLQCDPGSYLLRESMDKMERQLTPFGFVRVHRSVLVNGLWVAEMHSLAGGYALVLKNGTNLRVTRTYRNNLKALAELWLGDEAFLEDGASSVPESANRATLLLPGDHIPRK